MLESILYRPTIAKLAMAAMMAAQMLGWITLAQAGEPAPVPPPPWPNSLPAVRRALREFDRFLDHHPSLEERLRLDATLAATKAFLESNPELSDFLRANPNVEEGLKIYPRYFLNRALLRQASAPLSFRELASFKDLFQEQPSLEQELKENPESIRDRVFLRSHPALRDFLTEHPELGRVFLPSSNHSES